MPSMGFFNTRSRAIFYITPLLKNMDYAKLLPPNVEFLKLITKKSLLPPSNQHCKKIIMTRSMSFQDLKNISLSTANALGMTCIPEFIYDDEFALDTVGRLRDYFKKTNLFQPSYTQNENHGATSLRRFRDKQYLYTHLPKNLRQLLPISSFVDFKEYGHVVDKKVAEIARQVPFPMFIKPTDRAGSSRTFTVDTIAQLKHSLNVLANLEQEDDYLSQTYNLNKTYIVSEYLTGTVYACDSFVFNGKVFFSMCNQYLTPPHFYVHQGNPCAVISLDKKHRAYATLESMSKRLLNAMGNLPNGIFHTEFFETPSGQFRLLETAARPGDGNSQVVGKLAYGIDKKLYHLQLQTGILPPVPKWQTHAFSAWFPKADGRIKALTPIVTQSLAEMKYTIQPNMESSAPTSLDDFAAEMCATNTHWDILHSDFMSLHVNSPYIMFPEKKPRSKYKLC